MNSLLRASIAAGLMLGASPADAATVTGQFNVQLTIEAQCQVSNANTLDFGTTGGWTSNIDATTTFQVQCTTGVPYQVGLNAGQNALAGVRRMKHGVDAAYVEVARFI